MNFDLPGVYSARRHDPKLKRRQAAIARFMEIYRDETSFLVRIAYKFGRPLAGGRDTRLARYLDSIKRWWAWQIEPESTTAIAKIRLFLSDSARDRKIVGQLSRDEERFRLRDNLREAFARAGIDRIE